MARIPLDLYAEVQTADGARYKWDANQAPGSRLRNVRFGTKLGEGFSDGGGQFARRIDQDYPDLNLVNTVTFTGADGSVAYEGRLEGMPRELGDQHTVGVQLAGWMAHAKDRRFQEVYVDRRITEWDGPDLDRRAAFAAASQPLNSFSTTVDGTGMSWNVNPEIIPNQSINELYYRMPPGLTASQLAFQGAQTGSFTSFETPTVISGSSHAISLDNTLHLQPFTTPGTTVMLRLYLNGGTTTPATPLQQRYSKLAVYGSHGVTLRDGEIGEPQGVYASDVIRDIVTRFCPKLDPSGIQDTTYTVQQLAFTDRTYPYDAFLELNKYHLWNLAVWEDKQVVYAPYDLTDYDWEIRTDDPGTTFTPQGPSTENLFNGIVVTYTDILTGRVGVLSPDTYSDLTDSSLENPWNQHGIQRWDEITLSKPSSLDTALQLGRAALADRNRPRTPGTITVRGYIRDRAGNWQPVWKVRAGDTVAVTNFPNDTPRLIVETGYEDETKQASLSIDRPFALLDAYLDRLGNALGARGLA